MMIFNSKNGEQEIKPVVNLQQSDEEIQGS